jgi:peptide/nickel transport system substrate-binding protein
MCFGCTPSADVSEPLSSGVSDEIPQTSPQTFAIPYSKEDTLNPYTAATEVNLNLAGLLYDSLTVIDGKFSPQLSLAASVTPTDVTHLTVTLREGAVFSDGTAVTAADVKASFDAARASENYKELTKNMLSVAVDRKTGALTFTLAKGDPNAAACLSFPVIKAATLTSEAGAAPVGGGVYVYTADDDGATLTANPNRAQKPRYTTVHLRHLPNSDTMYYGLASGNITYYYNDLNSGEPPRVSGASAKVNMNAMLYLGVNGANASLSQPTVRRALSLLIDRAGIASLACAGWALPATLPFHPVWSGVGQTQPLFGEQDLAGALELLDTAGEKKQKLELIYSTDNGTRGVPADMVRSQLENAGLQVTVTPLGYEEYLARLKNGQYDLYIGEVRLAANMDLDPLLAAGEARYGIATDGAAAQAYRRYRDGTGTLQEFVTAFGEDMPYIPLCWRCGFAAYDRRLDTVTPHGYAPYFGLADWH